jgi:hypothetical protein
MTSAASGLIVGNQLSKGSVQYATEQFLLMTTGITFGSATTPYTIQAFFYPTSNRVAIIGACGTGSNGTAPFPSNCLSIKAVDSQTKFNIDSSGQANPEFNFATGYNLNAWNHIAITRDSSGYTQIWLNGVASSGGRQQLDSGTSNYFNPSRAIGAFVNQPVYNNTTKISSLRVTNTAEFNTAASTITVPTAALTQITGTQLLMNGKEFIDQSGVQTLTASTNSPTQSNVSNF